MTAQSYEDAAREHAPANVVPLRRGTPPPQFDDRLDDPHAGPRGGDRDPVEDMPPDGRGTALAVSADTGAEVVEGKVVAAPEARPLGAVRVRPVAGTVAVTARRWSAPVARSGVHLGYGLLGVGRASRRVWRWVTAAEYDTHLATRPDLCRPVSQTV